MQKCYWSICKDALLAMASFVTPSLPFPRYQTRLVYTAFFARTRYSHAGWGISQSIDEQQARPMENILHLRGLMVACLLGFLGNVTAQYQVDGSSHVLVTDQNGDQDTLSNLSVQKGYERGGGAGNSCTAGFFNLVFTDPGPPAGSPPRVRYISDPATNVLNLISPVIPQGRLVVLHRCW